MPENEPTKLYLFLKDKLKNEHELLQKVRNPPYLMDYQTPLDAYLTEVRGLQAIVRNQVNLELKLTETDGVPYDHLFDSNWSAVETEFERWGMGGILEDFEFINTGHFWVTVRSASFKDSYKHKAHIHLEKIKKHSNQLGKLYVPIGNIAKAIYDYENLFETFELFCFKYKEDLCKEERKKSEEHKIEFLSSTDFVRKGILSPSMVYGLVHNLENSSDLAKNHPGD